MQQGSNFSFLEIIINNDYIDNYITAVEFFFDNYIWKYYYCFCQVFLERGYFIVLVQDDFYILVKLEPRELPLDFVDQIFQILALLNIFEERHSQPLPNIKNRATNNLIFRLLYCCILKTTLPFLLFRNKTINDGILINKQGFLGRKFLRSIRIDLRNYSISCSYQITLRFITENNSSYINNNHLLKIILDKSINFGILYYYILKHVAYVIY